MYSGSTRQSGQLDALSSCPSASLVCLPLAVQHTYEVALRHNTCIRCHVRHRCCSKDAV